MSDLLVFGVQGVSHGVRAATLCAVTAVALAACSSSGGSAPSSGVKTTGSGTASATTPASSTPSSDVPTAGLPAPSASPVAGAAPSSGYYVSIGDSYAAGYQPTAPGKGGTNRNGFAYQTQTLLKAKGYDYTLMNFGCAGATSDSVLHTPGCDKVRLGPGATPYSDTQAVVAQRFLKAHRGKVGLITVSIGGNDLTPCGAAANAVTCVSGRLATVEKNLASLLTGLRKAAGPDTRIVGTTYPDVLLGGAVSTSKALQSTAALSVLAFQGFINPGLQKTYAAANAGFVDVTTATGAYLPMTQKTTLPPYGSIATAVEKVCELTFFCQFQDIHPRTNGYAIIAQLVASTVPKR